MMILHYTAALSMFILNVDLSPCKENQHMPYLVATVDRTRADRILYTQITIVTVSIGTTSKINFVRPGCYIAL